MESQRRGALYRAAQAILGRRAPDGRPAGNLGLTGAVVALRGRRNWRAGPAGQRKQRRGRGRVRAQAVSERGRRSRGLKRRGERLAGPGWERGALGLAGSLGRCGEKGAGLRKREGRGVGRRGLLGQEGRGKGGGGLGHFGFWAGCWVWFLSFGSLFLFLIQTKFEFKIQI